MRCATIIQAVKKSWIKVNGQYLPGVFRFPADVEVVFDDGETWDCEGGRDADGISIYRDLDGTVMEGSPLHQALVEGGVELEEVTKG